MGAPEAHSRFCSADTEIFSDTEDPSSMKTDAAALSNVSESWVSIVETEERSSIVAPAIPMETECEDSNKAVSRTAVKRKKSWIDYFDTDSLEDCASEPVRTAKSKVRITRKRTTPVAQSQDIPGSAPDNNDASLRSNSDMSQSGTDGDNRKGKVGRPKRKTRAIDPIMAEKEVISKTDHAPEQFEEDVLRVMTVSDVSAQALEYVQTLKL